MSVHYSGEQALSSGSVKKRLLDDLRILEAVPQANEIIQGKAGRIEERVLTWDVLARLHDNVTSNISQNKQLYLTKATDKLDKGTVKGKEKKLKKDKDGKQSKKDARGSADKDQKHKGSKETKRGDDGKRKKCNTDKF